MSESNQDPFELQRFVEAQNPVYERVCSELRAGRKRSHWMWFVFPQASGLGNSPMAKRYAIASLAEARAYLAHPLLGPRLRECVALVTALEGRSVDEIFGYPDNLKLRSSLTLFWHAADDRVVFQQALDKYYAGALDALPFDRGR